ncbi:hypothetical protein C7S17_4145 [Burkholderia thailandensis]|nr:hypothetical protein [Burkholderia thailandensis]
MRAQRERGLRAGMKNRNSRRRPVFVRWRADSACTQARKPSDTGTDHRHRNGEILAASVNANQRIGPRYS